MTRTSLTENGRCALYSAREGEASLLPTASLIPLSHASPWSFLFCHLFFFLGFRAVASCSCLCGPTGIWAAVSPKAQRAAGALGCFGTTDMRGWWQSAVPLCTGPVGLSFSGQSVS